MPIPKNPTIQTHTAGTNNAALNNKKLADFFIPIFYQGNIALLALTRLSGVHVKKPVGIFRVSFARRIEF